ncbi:MAG TPA: M48 family metallopeptidase [Terriglobales bacterium]|jgi:Zn-dependent protease with chaperone function|nr:M48 family metallopeptidase [Terriglobales bacterium]
MPVAASEFIHPADAAALENLRAIPLFNTCVSTFLKFGVERFVHGVFLSKNIRLSERQLPGIYKHLPPICDLFGIRVPDLYLEMSPYPDAYTIGEENVSICLTSGLLEIMSEEELHAVIAHECGHIVCQHMLYHTLAQFLLFTGANLLFPLEVVAEPVKMALRYWNRRCELSADRAGAVAVGSSKPIISTMIRLAGGPKSITDAVDLNVYLEQAEAYERLSDSTWDKTLQTVAVQFTDHPFLAVRTREIKEWGSTDQFQQLVQAIAARKGPKCSRCGRMMDAKWRFCNFCGAGVAGFATTTA